MNLAHRTPRFDDFETCACILEEGFLFEEKVRAQLPAIWRRLFADGQMISAVVEDQERPPEARIVAFGATVFVTDQFMNEIQANPIPYLSVRVIHEILRDNSPILTSSSIRHANAHDGLNLLVLHHTIVTELLSVEEFHHVRVQNIRAFLDLHSGYNIKEIIAEAISEDERKWTLIGLGGSYLLRSEYDSFYASQQLPPAHPRPWLLGLARAEALVYQAALLSPLLVYTPPRFFFREGEQELLKRALLGEIDDDIASSLHVSLSTVKKRWSAIYERVAEQEPELLPSVFDDNSQKRGAQKRHLLLRYLRHHPEELRPIE